MPTPSFKLTVDGLELTLVEFDGIEEMNRLFKYSFTTEVPTSGEKLIDIIDGDAIFVIEQYDNSIYSSGTISINGYISKASRSNGYWLLEFEPNLKREEASSYSKIYYNESTPQDIEDILQDRFDNLTSIIDYPPIFNFLETLPKRNLYCQFGESNLDFIGRMSDHWGLSFFYDHIDGNLVFENHSSGSGHYTEVFNNQLITTSSVSDNSIFKIINWCENISPVNSYCTIAGHDHNNAGTSIEASHPTDTTNKTEILNIIPDVVSQVEASYLAIAKHEAIESLAHTVSGESKIPYIFPGTIINTDDTEFPQVAIIKIKSTGRNLNSSNTGDAASYLCEFVGIPETQSYRPLPYYPIPKASTVIGKVISETSDLTLAQRNANGEYKAEILGFDTASTTAPWLRKAQTTAASNSIDIPLLPNTEVLIAFIDNNPNCPYIEHALENSLHPVPVTSANAHHAVIKTDGMLVKSSLEGRFNYSTTTNTAEITDTVMGASVQNHFNSRSGGFSQHSNFIDPSVHKDIVNDSATDDGADQISSANESSGDYLITRHYGDSIEIRSGDKLHWHNGNLYDFGGYWNYNLGNSYEENFIDQAAPLNIKVNKDNRSGDILSQGPNPGAISFSSLLQGGLIEANVKPASYSNTGVATNDGSKTFLVNSVGSWNADGMNITKDYNATYDYKFGEGIEVSDRVNSLEITHTDADTTAIEMNFHKGILRSWEKQVGRNTNEQKWAGNGKRTFEGSSSFDSSTNTKTEKETAWDVKGDTKISDSSTITTPNSITTDEKSFNMDTGALATHNIKTTNGMATAEMDFSFDATAASKFNFGASTSFALSAQADASLAISLSGNASIALEVGLNLDIKLSGGMTFEMKKDVGGLYKFNNGKFVAETEATILAATTAATIEAMGPTIQTISAQIVNSNAKLEKSIAKLSSAQVNIQNDLMHLIF